MSLFSKKFVGLLVDMALWCQMAVKIYTGSSKSLKPDSTKSLPELILYYRG